MNYNPMPVRMKALTDIRADELQCQPEPIPTGRGPAKPGDEFITSWIRCKHLEREDKAERIYEVIRLPQDTTPIKDVLIFTPVYRLEPETVEAVFALDWDGPLSWLFQRDNPHDSSKPKTNQLHQYQRGREAFLKGGYDAMLVIESDIIPPKDALKRLAALQADCGYGVYQFRRSRIINIFELYPTAEVTECGREPEHTAALDQAGAARWKDPMQRGRAGDLFDPQKGAGEDRFQAAGRGGGRVLRQPVYG